MLAILETINYGSFKSEEVESVIDNPDKLIQQLVRVDRILPSGRCTHESILLAILLTCNLSIEF